MALAGGCSDGMGRGGLASSHSSAHNLAGVGGFCAVWPSRPFSENCRIKDRLGSIVIETNRHKVLMIDCVEVMNIDGSALFPSIFSIMMEQCILIE